MEHQNPSTPPVRRRLFQDTANSEEDNLRNIMNELKEQSEKAKEKWNFDFENEVPLEGNWEWEVVAPEPIDRNRALEQENRPPNNENSNETNITNNANPRNTANSISSIPR